MARREGYWPRHPNKEIQAFLMELDEAGWRITKGSRYYKAMCPCREHRPFFIHLTPSSRYYLNKLKKHTYEYTCLVKFRKLR